MRPYDHYLLTRFNLPMGFTPAVHLEPAWLERRFELFERYCLPSVAGQLDQDFIWLLLLDERTPPSFRSRMRKLAAACAQARPVYLRPSDAVRQAVVETVVATVGRREPVAHLITSRMDNDDAIHKRYMQRLHELFDRQALQFVDFSHGYTYRLEDRTLRRYRHPSSPFVTLIEQCTSRPRTVFCAQHDAVSKVGPLLRLDTPPGWLQTIHDRNTSNTARGTPVRDDHAQLLRYSFSIQERSHWG